MYKEIWEASIRELLSCKKNFMDNNFADVMQSTKSSKMSSHKKFPLRIQYIICNSMISIINACKDLEVLIMLLV